MNITLTLAKQHKKPGAVLVRWLDAAGHCHVHRHSELRPPLGQAV
jgi:hypothetical protein